MGMRMYKRCRDGEVEPRKKKKEGVEDGDEEEDQDGEEGESVYMIDGVVMRMI